MKNFNRIVLVLTILTVAAFLLILGATPKSAAQTTTSVRFPLWFATEKVGQTFNRGNSADLSGNNNLAFFVNPMLGNYPTTTVVVGADTTVTPDAAPMMTTSINVSTNSNFKGTFVANPTTGVVRITSAPTATFNVNSTADTLDALPGDGICADASNNCTLRAAIGEANALAGDDIINLPAGTYTTTLPTTGENLNANGDFDITGNTVITGASQTTVFVEAATTAGTATDRVFDIQANAVVTIQGLTVRNGRITGLTDRTRGGGINNNGTVTLNNVTVRDNQAIGVNVGSAGIRNDGPTITLDGVTVTNNLCNTSTGNCFGGGMYDSGDDATTNISNSSFTNNTSTSTSSNGSGFAAGFGKQDGGTLTIQNSTFSNNTGNGAGSGGSEGTGIRILGTSVTGSTVNITNTIISDNTGNIAAGTLHRGTGIAIRSNPLLEPFMRVTLINVTVNQNSGSDSGAGIFNMGGNVIINDSSITNNSLVGAFDTSGGGIFTTGGAFLRLNNTNVTGNNSTGGTSGSAGGIGVFDSFMTLTNCTVSNNNADLNGGIKIEVGFGNTVSTNINNTTVSGNTASEGGGITNTSVQTQATSTVNITNSTISGNSATGDGGGILQFGFGTMITNINNSTVANNTANSDNTGGGDGGGIEPRTGTVNIKSSIVADNMVGTGGSGPDCFGTLTSGDYNLIENTAGCTISGTTANNITGVDPNLGALANNGGPTMTHALLPGSPAIDKGNSFGETTDQRGFTRPVDFMNYPNASGGDGSDIGAFELQNAPTAASVTVGGRVATAFGRGIGKARVYLTDSQGNTRIAQTNPFGYYRFADVQVGETYILSVFAKRYQFENPTQILNLNNEIENVNFTALSEAIKLSLK